MSLPATKTQSMSTQIYVADLHCATLTLLPDATLEFQWTDEWLSSGYKGAPFEGIPYDAAVHSGASVDWIFDSFYIPTSLHNRRRMMKRLELDPDDDSALNRRRLLFLQPYREYAIAFGAPCSAFDAQVSTTLREVS